LGLNKLTRVDYGVKIIVDLMKISIILLIVLLSR